MNTSPHLSATSIVNRIPPHFFFAVSAVFHYLGPSFAVLLFQSLGVLGVAWLRIASAAIIFAAWRRPWRVFQQADRRTLLLTVALGATFAAMNVSFYIAIDRVPLATVAAVEFVAPVAIAMAGVASRRNGLALALAVAGAALLLGFRWATDWLGIAFALLNAVLFGFYIVVGHAVSRSTKLSPIDLLAGAMLVALVLAFPFGVAEALPAFADPWLLLASIGVGVSSSVIPYVCDQLAMARLPRASFALMLTLLPAMAAVIGAIVLGQIPSALDCAGIGLVVLGVGLHRPSETA